MNSRLAGTLGVWVVAGAALVAADFWETKHFTTWSDKEVEKMLGDSPWSREVTVPSGACPVAAVGMPTVAAAVAAEARASGLVGLASAVAAGTDHPAARGGSNPGPVRRRYRRNST